MKKKLYVSAFLLTFSTINSMNYFTNFFSTNEQQEEQSDKESNIIELKKVEKYTEELQEKTKNPKHVFIDLGALYQANETIAQEKIVEKVRTSLDVLSTVKFGFTTIFSYVTSSEKIGEKEKKTLFTFLKNLSIPEKKFKTSDQRIYIYDQHGEQKKLPKIFSSFFLLTNKEKEEELRTHIHNELNNTEYESSLKKVLSFSIDVMFNSSQINEIMELNKEMYVIAKKLKNSGHNLILTGNIPTHAFNDFIKLEKGNPIKQLFDEKDCFISGSQQLLTPQQEFYTTIFKAYDIHAKNCIVVNEHKENMQKACCLGTRILRFKHFDTEETTREKFNKKLELALLTENI